MEQERDTLNPCTTLLVRSLPWTFQEKDLLDLLDSMTGPGSYDFFYMPWNAKRNSNSGYAFVNFVNTRVALKAAAALSGRTFKSRSKSIQPIIVLPARVQGLVNNLEAFRDGCPGLGRHGPMAFANGVRMPIQQAVDLYCSGGALTDDGHPRQSSAPPLLAPAEPFRGEFDVARRLAQPKSGPASPSAHDYCPPPRVLAHAELRGEGKWHDQRLFYSRSTSSSKCSGHSDTSSIWVDDSDGSIVSANIGPLDDSDWASCDSDSNCGHGSASSSSSGQTEPVPFSDLDSELLSKFLDKYAKA